MKKILFATLCTALLVSCASGGSRAITVDSTLAEAKALKALAKAQGIEVPSSTDYLISSAEKKNEERQAEEAFNLADEAVLQLQLSMLKREQAELLTENSNAQSNLNATTEALVAARKLLNDNKKLSKSGK